ncbi:MAG: hypothetical protein EBU90_21710 [Proteobacteria bacterium]|nr:hypothetical protein [Pseudomonadota bacterium]
MLLRTNNQQGSVGKTYGDLPSLNLDFTQKALDPRVTLRRTSNATVIDSDGVLKYAPHNLLGFSETFNNVVWGKNAVIITPDSTTSPIGTQTADLFEFSAISGRRITQDVTSFPYQIFTYSVYIKMITGTGLSFLIRNATKAINIAASFFTWNGTNLILAGSNPASAPQSLTFIGDGWYRVSMTIPSVGFTGSPGGFVSIGDTLTFYMYGGNSTGDTTTCNMYLWGAQVNVGSTALDYYSNDTSAPVYGPRFDYDPVTLNPLGLLIEEPVTNLIRNSIANGASSSTGTTSINSGTGTIPSFYTFTTSVTGLTGNVAAVGTESGLSYCDFRIFGTPGSTGNVLLTFDSAMPVAPSNRVVRSSYLKISGGSSSGIQLRSEMDWSNAAGFVGKTSDVITLDSAALLTRRYQANVAIPATPTDINSVNFYLSLGVTSGTPVDLTFRVAAPQVELTQGNLQRNATSFVPSATAATSRSGDVANSYSTNFSSWFNLTEGTFYSKTDTVAVSNYATVIGVAPVGSVNGTDSIEVYHLGGGNQARFNFDVGGTTTLALYPQPGQAQGDRKLALACSYSSTLRAVAANSTSGALFAANTFSASYSPSIAYAYIGSRNNDLYLNGHIKSLRYYRKGLSNTKIQILANTAY